MSQELIFLSGRIGYLLVFPLLPEDSRIMNSKPLLVQNVLVRESTIYSLAVRCRAYCFSYYGNIRPT